MIITLLFPYIFEGILEFGHSPQGERAAAPASTANKPCTSLGEGTEDGEVRPSRKVTTVVSVMCSVALINSALDSTGYPLHSKMVNTQGKA